MAKTKTEVALEAPEIVTYSDAPTPTKSVTVQGNSKFTR